MQSDYERLLMISRISYMH